MQKITLSPPAYFYRFFGGLLKIMGQLIEKERNAMTSPIAFPRHTEKKIPIGAIRINEFIRTGAAALLNYTPCVHKKSMGPIFPE